MFRKLVSNLPFTPSLIQQVGFYTRRLKKEQASRTVSLFVVLLAIVIQLVTLLAPAQATLAANSSDLIYNGNGKTRAGILEAYHNNRDQLGRTDIQKILSFYQISGSDLEAGRVVTIHSSLAKNYWVVGRSPRGYGGEISQQIPNGPLLYARSLYGWAANHSWAALEINTSTGKRWILLENGNLVLQPSKSIGPSMNSTNATDQTCNDGHSSCLSFNKTARNITQQLADANGTTAHPGDTIEYTLAVTNRGPVAHAGYVVEENLEDVLEYADIIDASGGTFNNYPVKMLSWQPVEIKPGETIQRTVLVQVKSQLPMTPASTSDPQAHDMKMVNTFGGSTVQIKLPSHPLKIVEQTATNLPPVGLTANLAISGLLALVTVFFYFRSRVMVKELGVIKQQFNYSSGV